LAAAKSYALRAEAAAAEAAAEVAALKAVDSKAPEPPPVAELTPEEVIAAYSLVRFFCIVV
jgi:hypothetical protein